MDTQHPWNYTFVPEHDGRIADVAAAVEPDSPAARYQVDSPKSESGTPKAPLLPFGGRPGRPCPGAPKKGRAAFSHFDLSGEAPVRRLSFGSALGSQSTEEDIMSDSMDDDDMLDDEYEQQHEQEQAQRQPQPVQQHLQQAWHLQQHQMHLPSPQQLFRQQLQAVQQPLCHSMLGQMQPLQVQPQQQQQLQPQQPTLWNPLSPTGTRPPPVGLQGAPQGSATPCRLFR